MMTALETAHAAIALVQDSYEEQYERMGQRVATLSYEDLGRVVAILTSYATSAVLSLCGEVIDPATVFGALGQAVIDTAQEDEDALQR